MKLKRRFGVVLLMAMLVMAMTVTASAAKKVKLNKKSATLSVGKTVTLRVKNAGSKKVTWASSNVNVAVVEDGVVTAVDAGKATIRATVGAKTLKCKVTVKAAAEQASVAIVGYSSFEPRLLLTGSAGENGVSTLANTQALDVLRGTTQYDLKPHVQTTPAGAALTWTSSNEKVATVKDGVVKAVSDGTALITVSANGASDSIVAYVTGMGSDEETNPVVITMANYDRLFNKYFEKVTVRTVFLDVNGNIISPGSFTQAEVVVDGKTHDITSHVAQNFYEEKYYIVCKDSRVDALKSSGSGNFLVWETVNNLSAKGGEPVLTETKRLGLVNPNSLFTYSVWDEVQKTFVQKTSSNPTTLGAVTIPNAGNIPFTYYTRLWNTSYLVDATQDVDVDLAEFAIQKAAGLCKVTVSDPSMAGKTVLGFGPYGVSGKPKADITYSTVTIDGVKVRYIDKVNYTTNAFTGETFREINFVLYLK